MALAPDLHYVSCVMQRQHLSGWACTLLQHNRKVFLSVEMKHCCWIRQRSDVNQISRRIIAPISLPELSYGRPHEGAWLIRINDINQELLVSTNGCLRHLMIIYTSGQTRQPTGGGCEGGGRYAPDPPCGVVRSRGVCLA